MSEQQMPSHDRCGNCGTRLTDENRFVHKDHAMCAECTSAYISWDLDGGRVDDPDRWAWLESLVLASQGAEQ